MLLHHFLSILIFHSHFHLQDALKIFEHSLSSSEYKLFYHRTADFGPSANAYNVSGRLQLMANYTGCNIDEFHVNEDASSNSNNYRQIYENDVVLILRGDCTFSTKVYHAQLLGAIGVVIGDYNTSNGEEWIVMSKDNDGHDIKIPAMFVPHNTYSWIRQLLLSYMHSADNDQNAEIEVTGITTTDQVESTEMPEDAVYAMLDGDGEYVAPTNGFWLAAFGIVIIVIPTLWCFIVCLALLRKKIISYVQGSRRRKHLNTIPIILYKGCTDSTSEKPTSSDTIFAGTSSTAKLPAIESSIGIGLSLGKAKGEMAEDISTSYAKLESDEEQRGTVKDEKQSSEQVKVDETEPSKLQQDGSNDDGMDSGKKMTSSLFAGKNFQTMSRFLLNPFRAKEEHYSAPHNDSCAICLDDFKMNEELRLLPCKHGFHIQCIDPWLSKSSELCPMCKQSIFMTHNDEDEEAAASHGCLHSVAKICCIAQRAGNNRQQANNEDDNNDARDAGNGNGNGNMGIMRDAQSAENEDGVIVLTSQDELVAIESDSDHSQD